MRRRAVLLLPALLAACASPDPAYYTLIARPGPVSRGAPKLVELRRIGLAGYLDRSEIVRNNNDYRLRIPGGERWGEPLGQLITRVLAENLNARLPGSSVFADSGAISAIPDATVEVDIQRFDADASNQVVLLAQVAVSRERDRDRRTARTLRLTAQPSGPTTTDLVAAMSAALAQLADRVATILRTGDEAAKTADRRPSSARRARRR